MSRTLSMAGPVFIVIAIFTVAVVLSQFETRGFYSDVNWAVIAGSVASVSVILAFLGLVLWFLARYR